MPTFTFERRPSSVREPGVEATSRRASADGETSGRWRESWFGSELRTSLKASVATGTESGCATHVPSKPLSASRCLSSRTDEEAAAKAREAIAADKKREAEAGFDGTWVAHPDSVETALEAFDAVLGDKPNQIDKKRDDVSVTAADLLAIGDTPGEITEAGLRSNVNVGIQYISSWLRGNGAAGIYGLMEDAATAEIARGQVWQWIHHEAELDDGRTVTPELVRELATSELEKIREEIGDDEWFEKEGRPDLSRSLFERVALSDDFVEFLTLPAYDELLKLEKP